MIDLDPKAWRTIAGKFKVKDNGLEKALASYEKLAEDAHDESLKAIGTITQLAGTLKRAKEVVAAPPLFKFVGELISAAESKKNEVTKLKAAALKEHAEAEKSKAVAAKAQADAEKTKAAEEKAAADEKVTDDDDQKGGKDDKQAGGFKALIISLLQKVKTAKSDAPYQYLYCEAKPFPCVIFAKQINPGHRKMLEKISGGSKRFLKPGFVTFEDNHYCFSSDKNIPGAARGLQGFLKNITGRKFPVIFGTQKAADEEGGAEGAHVAGEDPKESTAGATAAAAAAGAGAAARPAQVPELAKGSQAWKGTCDGLLADVKALGKAIQAQCAGEPPGFTKEIDGYLEKLERNVASVGRTLEDSLIKANEAPDSAARKAELARSKALMAETVARLKPLAALIDTNPFTTTGFSAKLTSGLTVVAQGITRAQSAA
jgi:hypothetical protein